MGDEPKLSYLVINKNNFEKLIRELLLVKQYRVEVYTKPSQSHNNDWILEYKGSPGNQSQFEDILYANDDIVYNNCVLGVKLGAKKVMNVGFLVLLLFNNICTFLFFYIYIIQCSTYNYTGSAT